MHRHVMLAALGPAALLVLAFVVYCLFDLIRRPGVRYLPRWAWALVCCVSVPLGGILYLILGRSEE